MQKEVLVQRMAEAIARQEGFYKQGSRAQRNNNPGNLRPYNKEQARDSGGYRTFGKEEWGWDALRMQIWRNINRDLTFEEFFCGKPGVYAGYAPAADNNHPHRYAKFVVEQIGLEDDGPVSPVFRKIKEFFDA